MRIPPGRPKMAVFFVFTRFFSNFVSFQNVFQNLLRQNDEKSAKIEIFGFPQPPQKPSKMPAKSMSRQACDFLAIFARKMLCCKNVGINSGQLKLWFRGHKTFFCTSPFVCIFGPKNLPKTLPKRGPSPSKINAKNVSNPTSIFCCIYILL